MIDAEELKGDVIEMILDTALNSEELMPRTSGNFITLIKRIKNALPQSMKAILDTIHLSATYYHQIKQLLKTLSPIQKRSESIFVSRMNFLIHNEFIISTPSEIFSHLPRYLKALMIRIEKYPSRVDKDAIMQKDIDRIHQLLSERLKPYVSKKITPPKALKDFPELGNKEDVQFDLISAILTSGKNSRLYKKLVYEDQTASSAVSFQASSEISSNFIT